MASKNAAIDMVDIPRTLGDLMAAVEGLRGQLSTFSMQALAEIDLLQYSIQRKIDEGTP
jgi:hypothetical protein